jgi:hypothetical protein
LLFYLLGYAQKKFLLLKILLITLMEVVRVKLPEEDTQYLLQVNQQKD